MEETVGAAYTSAKKTCHRILKIYAIILVCVAFLIFYYHDTHVFTTKKWVDSPKQRVNMVDDLLNHYSLEGLSRSEIMNLLGNETEGAYFKEVDNMVYYLGNERGFISIDSEWLIIHFVDNVVNGYEIVTD